MVAISALRRLLRLVKRAPDRLRHKSRRSAATEMLRASVMPKSILVVCHGNLCRSPYAAAAIRLRATSASLAVNVESGGFYGLNRSPPAEALAAAAKRGTDMSAHRSRTLDRDLLDAADLIVVMEPGQGRAVTARFSPTSRRVLVLGDLDPKPIRTRAILDPIGSAAATFDECYERIDRCVEQLVGLLPGPK